MAERSFSTEKAGAIDQQELAQALTDGLAGRKALLRAYETVSERVADEETRTMLRRFTEEEKQEYEKAEAITRRMGGDPSAVTNIRNEVMAFLGKGLFAGKHGRYQDARDLGILYGLESAGHLGAELMMNVAERAGDNEWREEVKKSIERSESHRDWLEGRVHDLGSAAFSPSGGPS